ncbi:MAG: hypothetical protein ACJASQ_001018 [Crocinitomicaceae bacterium]|jgi:hypothetical protein
MEIPKGYVMDGKPLFPIEEVKYYKVERPESGSEIPLPLGFI